MASSKFPILNQKKVDRKAKTIPNEIKPLEVDWSEANAPARIKFSDGEMSFGSCIRCTNPPCIEYAPSELKLPIFEDFPADQNNNICPTSAISWLPEDEAPKINPEDCISCGICISRCPVRAIYFDGNKPKINDLSNKHFVLGGVISNSENTLESWRKFDEVEEKGSYQIENDLLLKTFRNEFQEICKRQVAQFPNHLARNLLIALGIGAAMRRRGDNNIRMDLILGPPGINFGTGEVEFGYGVLDSPRNILDDIAVLVGRYELSKNDIIPLIVCLDFPNQRSEYWQFIKDVKDVLNVKINSATIGGLVLLLWNRIKLSIKTGDELYLDIDSPNLRLKLEKLIGRKLHIEGDGYPGLLGSAK